jgi:hypothetical protein
MPVAIPVYVTGQVLDAPDCNLWFLPRAVRKAVDESVTSSITLQNDDELFLTADANAQYLVFGHVIYDGAAAGDISIAWSGPASATFDWVSGGIQTGASTGVDTVSTSAQILSANPAIGAIGAGSNLVIPLQGILVTAGTAGTLQFRWAQNTSSATATRVRAGSVLAMWRIG